MHTFYSSFIQNGHILLPEEETRHAFRVLRLHKGDQVNVFDGEGNIFRCSILSISKKEAVLEILSKTKPDFLRPQLRMLVAPTKNTDRFEWFVEKAAEMGVSDIFPVITEHSERKVIKLQRLEKIIISAMKQSGNPWKPRLHEIKDLDNLLNNFRDCQRFIAYCGKTEKIRLYDAFGDDQAVAVLIGPEGDFSPGEVKSAMAEGWKPVTLGNRRYRTETAAVLAVHTFHLKRKSD